MEENINEENSPLEEKKPDSNARILGLNLLILAGYTVLCVFLHDSGPFLDALFLVIHVITCIILAVVNGKGVWVLSGLLVLLIGVSTCVGLLWGNL